MKQIFTLGKFYVSDFIPLNESPSEDQKEELAIVIDDISPRLSQLTDLDKMYGKYWYRSDISDTMRNQLKEIALEASSCIKTKIGDAFLDIACNSGELLKNVPNTFIKYGIDPVEDRILNDARKIARISQNFFSKEVYWELSKGMKAKIVTCIAMFYDLEHPDKFLQDVYEIMDDEGVLVMQLSYTPLMIEQLAFDNIVSEHYRYHSLMSVEKLADQTGFDIVDCQLNDINGGSFRVYLRKSIATKALFKTAPYRDVASLRVRSLLRYEVEHSRPNSYVTWRRFFKDIEQLKEDVVSFIKKEKKKGKSICAIGASTKGNTLLQYFGLNNTLIDAISERSEFKVGLKTIGTNIPIVSEKELRQRNPDYILVLIWHFIAEITERENDYLQGGGKFIVPCPRFEIIGK